MSQTIFRFSGMNNVLDAAQIPRDERERKPVYSTAADLLNVDPGSGGKVRRRLGRRLLTPGNFHSLFSTEFACYIVQGRTLCAVGPGPDYLLTPIAVLSSATPGCYDSTPIGTVFSNGTDIGLIEGRVYAALPTPAPTVDVDGISVPSFKEPLPAGAYAAWFNGMIFTLRDEDGESWLYHTDGYDLAMDSRENFLRFAGKPAALVAVDDGLYVGAGGKLYFLAGDGPEDFQERRALDFAAIPGAFCVDRAEDLPLETVRGRVAVFKTSRGFVLGGNGGTVQQRTEIDPATAPIMRGAVMVRRERGETHFVAALQGAEVDRNSYVPPDLDVQVY